MLCPNLPSRTCWRLDARLDEEEDRWPHAQIWAWRCPHSFCTSQVQITCSEAEYPGFCQWQQESCQLQINHAHALASLRLTEVFPECEIPAQTVHQQFVSVPAARPSYVGQRIAVSEFTESYILVPGAMRPTAQRARRLAVSNRAT